jgi:hypothetical protein
VDLEASYQFKLDNWGIPGNFAIRALGTKTYKWILCPGAVGTVCINEAGALGNYSTSTTYNAEGGTIPTWKVVYNEDYSTSWGTFTLIQRWFNAGTFSNNRRVPAPNCPVQTAFQAMRTIRRSTTTTCPVRSIGMRAPRQRDRKRPDLRQGQQYCQLFAASVCGRVQRHYL